LTGRSTGKASSRTRSLHDRALGLLAVRPRSRREIHERLLRAGFDEAEVTEEANRLAEVGLIDDLSFAQALVDHHVNSRRSGLRGIRMDLASHGIPRDVADAALAGQEASEAERADILAADRARRMGGTAPEKAYPRLVSLLLRRGHSPDVARSSARRALHLGGVDD
jgi:regulatory protein